ncbi:MMPL family transporter [Streptomyces sp. AC536]|uniref:MMPL family transporter n=1 Tax=Streptomyces buecherae TaxID=2763006 RepID=UPI00164EAB98|nr:MMPL family transporter [Streptomyces buecherae]MBC3981369.1 MMPL family transporter [Streptomyces buecherae]QNJ41636.1 MMPL family transporter [Streptomyces buecherae]
MPAWSKRLPVLPGGRRSKWVVLLVWLILAVALGPLAGKLGDVEENGPNAFLPSGAESAQVNTELEKFRADELTAAVAVYTRDGGLTAADRAKVAADRARFAEFAAEGQRVARAEPSADGQALITTVPLSGTDGLTDDVDAVREIADADAPPGLTTEVGGPAASLTDTVEVFNSLDSTLMIITGAVVAALLLLTYRSPVLWLFPLLAVGFGAVLTQVTTYLLARHAGLPVDGQSGGMLMVLVFGVGTDYALLLIARYREELHQHADRHQAMAIALRRCGPAILASAGTIAVGLACLAFSDINSSRSLGLVGAVGVGCAFVAMITVLPALLVIAGRWVFWPFIPRHGTAARTGRTPWAAIGAAVARRPRWAWLASLGLTGALALSALGITMGLSQAEMFQDKPDSVIAQERVSAHYPSGASDPADVVTRADGDRLAQVRAVAAKVPGVASVGEPQDSVRTGGHELATFPVVLKDAPDSDAAKDTVDALRDAVHAVDGADALVGGTTAQAIDTERAADRDLTTVIPIVLLVVLAVLIWLLRSLVAPLLLLATVVVSYFAALGTSHLLFEHVLDFAAMDWSTPLMGFVFLVALGIDYNIFLMTRVREETERLGHARGVLAGLTGTGGVITSAGIVLAATFAVFAVLPLVTMAQLGVLVGVGVLLDTFLVRTVLVPALALDIGPKVWWPGALSRAAAPHSPPPPGARPREAAQEGA